MNLLLLLEMANSVDPNRVAFRSGDSEITVAQLSETVRAIGTVLHRGGFPYLAFAATNSLAFPVAVFSAAVAGIPLVPINYRLAESRRDMILARHPGALVIADETQVAVLAGSGYQAVSPDEFLRLNARRTEDLADPDPEEVAILLYTSGTTSEPKAVVLRHRHLTSYVVSTVECDAAESTDAALVAVPPYHIAGVAHVLTNLYAGRRVIYLDAFDADAWLALVRKHGVTHAMVVPTMLARIVDALESEKSAVPSTLRSIVYGGAAMPAPTLERALRAFPEVGFVNAYGLTETASTIALLGPEDHRRALDNPDPKVRKRLLSAGKIVPGIEIEIRSPDGSPLGPDTDGEIYVRGPQVSGEYLGADKSGLVSGWFATRDNGYLDDEGYLFINGRADDTIIRGGENIAPAEIESVIALHPGVADCAVVGVSDDEWGQQTVAIVVPRPTAQLTDADVKQWVRERLRGSRTPDQVEFRTTLPYTETGKLLRRSLRSELESTSDSLGGELLTEAH